MIVNDPGRALVEARFPLRDNRGPSCRDGGIGRRSGLKIRRWRHHEGSIPSPGTTLPMRLEDFDYALPPELIAQVPARERTGSRLLHLDGRTGALRDLMFGGIVELIS